MEQRPLKKFIVITSIFKPTEAIEAFSKLKDYHLVVVGDKKSPVDWQHENCTYLNVAAQIELASSLATAIPFNHYGRKMIGYVYAMKQGADIIIDTDDDNIPYADWNFPPFEGSYRSSGGDLGWVNIYHHFSEQPRTAWAYIIPTTNPSIGNSKPQPRRRQGQI